MSPSPAEPAAQRRSRVLIADDNEPNRELAKFKPDVILLDVMMPKLSGFEVCQRLKADPATSPIMVLMVTALGELGDIERAVESGTDDFLSKPVNRVELVKRVENMLKLRHVTDELERLRSYISSMDDDQPPR
jgi:DNA-binding response OmpR family regulator